MPKATTSRFNLNTLHYDGTNLWNKFYHAFLYKEAYLTKAKLKKLLQIHFLDPSTRLVSLWFLSFFILLFNSTAATIRISLWIIKSENLGDLFLYYFYTLILKRFCKFISAMVMIVKLTQNNFDETPIRLSLIWTHTMGASSHKVTWSIEHVVWRDHVKN